MQTDPQRTALLRTLKGAPLSCIFAMLLWPDRSLDANTIANLTGYDRKTVSAGLATLSELALAQHHGRRAGWLLTATARQLILPSAITESNGEKFPTLGCSSGLILSSVSGEDLKPPPPQNPSNGEKFPTFAPLPDPDPDVEDLITWLRDHIGCPDRLARIAARAATDREDYDEYTRYQALRWLAYTKDRHGSSLTFPGGFIARQLEKGYPCPDTFHEDPYSALGQEINRAYSQWQLKGDDQ